MKKKLMEALKTKFPGVEDAILDRIATKRGEAITDEAEIPTLVEGIGFQDVLTSYGDYRAGDASSKAVRSYEQKHNLKDGKTIQASNEEGGDKTPQPTDKDSLTAIVQAAIKPFADKITAMESEKRNTSFVSRVKDALKDVDEDFYTVALEGRTFETEEDADAFTTGITEKWKSFTEKHTSQGLSFSPPSRSKNDTEDELGDIVNKIQQTTEDRNKKS